MYLTPLLISMVLMFLQQFSGINAVISYTPALFKVSKNMQIKDQEEVEENYAFEKSKINSFNSNNTQHILDRYEPSSALCLFLFLLD